MSHLGDRLSALIDGELNGAERDRAYAHLASCPRCRTEAAELRALKAKLRSLNAGPPAEEAMTRRLAAMAGPGPLNGSFPPRQLRLLPAPRPASARVPRRRYLVLGAASVLIVVGTAAFTAGGGGQAAPGPRITPPVQMYSVEHAIITGEIPFTGPSARAAWSGSDAPQP